MLIIILRKIIKKYHKHFNHFYDKFLLKMLLFLDKYFYLIVKDYFIYQLNTLQKHIVSNINDIKLSNTMQQAINLQQVLIVLMHPITILLVFSYLICRSLSLFFSNQGYAGRLGSIYSPVQRISRRNIKNNPFFI